MLETNNETFYRVSEGFKFLCDATNEFGEKLGIQINVSDLDSALLVVYKDDFIAFHRNGNVSNFDMSNTELRELEIKFEVFYNISFVIIYSKKEHIITYKVVLNDKDDIVEE